MSILRNINTARNSTVSTILTKSSITSTYGTSTWYHNLPVQVLVNIFQYFDEKDLTKNIALVCKRWRYASNSPELWKKLEFYGKDVPTTFICRKIRDLAYLKSVRVDNIAEPIAVIRQIYRCNPNIKHVAIRNCSTIPETALRNLIQRCRKLESLDLSGTKFRANRFYEEIAGLINLRSVNLSKNSWLSVRNLLSVVLNCHKLEELQLSSFCPLKPLEQLSDEDASFIISNLAPNLKVLILDASTLTNFSFKAIMHCNKLEQLGLYGAGNLSPDVFTRIWEHLPNLKMLKVRYAHQITGQHIVELFELGRNARIILGLDIISTCL
ncbi:hypothetical protein ILUMI_25429 [Ignelater luminosus]|uniref:F-box domain-containing protein n=1 Tax=Ignelater luminosus TaxID=2038154 RepID=A0A8K0C8K5_IGNLU|nr:hypothetical protein ILUMI_25429 [Ignelater luminosus]